MDLKTLLGELARSPDLEPFRALIEPLEAYDDGRGAGLVRTLRVYLSVGANAKKAADRLFLHRNSMLYRLARIEKITGADLKNPRVGLILQLGLLAVEGEERRNKDAVEHP